MKRVLLIIAGLVVLGVAAVGLYALRTVQHLEAESVTPEVWMITGLGGNVAVLRTADGSVVVDSMTFTSQGESIRALAEQLAGPVQALINTHHHGDHTHGNPGFEPGTRVVSTRRALEHLRRDDAAYWEGEAAALLPNDTFEESHELNIGGKTVRVLHPGRGHTDGDAVILFVEDRVLHTGDLLFHNLYPNIDLESGGSLAAWSATLDRVLELDFDQVVPGHGPVTDRGGVLRFQAFVDQLWMVGQKAAREGWTLEQTQATRELTADEGFGMIAIPLVLRLDRPFVLGRAWEEANGTVKAD